MNIFTRSPGYDTEPFELEQKWSRRKSLLFIVAVSVGLWMLLGLPLWWILS